jgi:hypothetical protein
LLLYIFVVLPLTATTQKKVAANTHLKFFVLQQLAMLMVGALQIRTGYREGSQHQTFFMKFGTGPPGFFTFMAYQAGGSFRTLTSPTFNVLHHFRVCV